MDGPSWQHDKELLEQQGVSSDLLFHDRQGDSDDQYMEDLDMEGGEYDYLNDLEEPSDHEVWECQQGTAALAWLSYFRVY